MLDLGETLVQRSFKDLRLADLVLSVEIEGLAHNVPGVKRRRADKFMKSVCGLHEVVVFTASVSRQEDPLGDEWDVHRSVHHSIF